MSDTLLIILLFLDLCLGFFALLYLKNYTKQFNWIKAALIKSLVYSLFFGIGALGEGGGEPGFMLPCPILPASIVAVVENDINVLVQNALYPYIFWAALIFLFYCAKQAIKNLKNKKRVNSKDNLPIT